MDFYSPWVFFVLVALALAFVSLPAFRGADQPPIEAPNRLLTLDGLRGFLALAVVIYHAAIFHTWLVTGIWAPSPSHFYNAIGHMGFAAFFMITGFLFWSQLLRAQGKPAWIKLYVGRVFRIAPLFYTMVVLLFLVIAIDSHWTLHRPPTTIVHEIIRWSSLGFLTSAELNANPNVIPLAGVVWTLQFEWYFYLSLPLLAFAARLRRLHLLFVCLLLLAAESFIHLTTSPRKGIVSFLVLFLLGMAVASLRQLNRLPRLSQPVGSCLTLLLLALALHAPDPSIATSSQGMLGLAFLLMVSGCSLFGLLTSRPALRLGDISYSIYLLQGFALVAVFKLGEIRHLDRRAPIDHWALTTVAVLLLVFIALVTHTLIELPGIRKGKQVSGALYRRFAADPSH